MYSPQLQTESSQAQQDPGSAQILNEQHTSGARHTQGRRRRGLAFRRRGVAITAAVAVCVASGTAAIVTSADHAPTTTARGSNGAPAMSSSHGGPTYASFVRRVDVLEAHGDLDVACQLHGDLLYNPRTHRYVTVRM